MENEYGLPFVRPRPKKSVLPPSKKRKTNSAVEEINFDFDSRAEYLTGFHKRKVQRATRAKEEAAKKEREERVVMRKQLREERKQELEAHVAAVNALLLEANGPGFLKEDDKSEEDEAWNGIEDKAPPVEHIDHEEEYIDEDKYTTVTVEEVDITKEGLRYAGEDEEEELEAAKKQAEAAKKAAAAEETNKKKVWPKKEKKQKFRYESKTERRLTRAKQKASNKGKANARRGEE